MKQKGRVHKSKKVRNRASIEEEEDQSNSNSSKPRRR